MAHHNELETLATHQDILGKVLDKLKEKLKNGDDGFSKQEKEEISRINKKLIEITNELNSLVKNPNK